METARGAAVAPAADEARPKGSLVARAARTLWQFFTFCAGHRLWTACMLAFVLIWTIELYAVQDYTLVFRNETGDRYAFWAPKFRFVLDLLFISMLTLVLRRRFLIGAVIASFFVYLGLITYFEYFMSPLSVLTIFGNWREGLQVGGLGLEVFPFGPALLLLCVLAVKLTALVLSRGASLPRHCAWLMAAVLLAGYVGLSAVTLRYDPLDAILTTRGVGRLGYIRGYLGPWFAEWYYLSDDKLLERALELRRIDDNRISPLEADIPIHRRIVVVQAESLDGNILGYRAGGEEVTPFLNRLRDKSMYFRVLTTHTFGSSDADFAVLNGVRGSPHENTYLIPGYPYENTTPQILAECGFESYCYHGNSGNFYGRRLPYRKMDFTGVRFREELEGKFGLKSDWWGVDDREVLALSARELEAAEKPTCHFVITLTTHTPYTLLPESEHEIYPNPTTTAQRYINNMRYLDNCLRDYMTELDGGTTFLIYSDHPTEAFDGFQCDRELDHNKEYIPCFIYDSDEDLSKLQKTRGDPRATDGSWNLVDVANYLRNQIKRAYGPSPEKADIEKAESEKAETEKTETDPTASVEATSK